MRMKIQTLFLCLLTVGILACGKDDPVNNENGNDNSYVNGGDDGNTDSSGGNSDTSEDVEPENPDDSPSTPVEPDGSSDNNLPVGGPLKYEVCSPYKYQGNMTLMANVIKDGKALTHFQIAVFDTNGECRACDWSKPDYNGLAYLTIQGEGQGEILSIKITYQRNDEVREVTSGTRITYSNDAIIGSIESPYLIHIAGEKE